MAIIASYFVTVDTSAELNIQEITVEVVWLMAGTFSIGELIKSMPEAEGEIPRHTRMQRTKRTRR